MPFKTNSCKSCKIQDLASEFRGAKNSNHKILRKLNSSVRISYLLPTSQEKLMGELSAKSIFEIKIELEVLRDSRS